MLPSTELWKLAALGLKPTSASVEAVNEAWLRKEVLKGFSISPPQVGENVGCPTDNTTVLANCLRVSDPKALTLGYHLELTNLPSKPPRPCCGALPSQSSPGL